ncbi:MAG: hypothetical protein UV00_C0028G0002 [candidate division WWE3 bacterium GW2011_GWF1_42_14]|uniref:Uncharacterized protein n=1 Tax=candidate division WWE3 bacterium GW2011_GWF1_42_14 TaxID=1619138 RepID=A0A0G1BFL5_UNCKA|nr:MAG: hypothetical protein UV00_C0028G0002 [candidate division WWE3 bacterium GW2011_GWF1_42_14]
MKIFRQDIEEIEIFIFFIMFLFAVSYIADGGSSWLAVMLIIVFGTLALTGILANIGDSIKDYHTRKINASK